MRDATILFVSTIITAALVSMFHIKPPMDRHARAKLRLGLVAIIDGDRVESKK